ncbi:21402_t:CDS:2, partial [Gigaspora rosea]
NHLSLKYDALSKFDLENIWSKLYNCNTKFINLLESEIFDHVKPTNKNSDLAWKQFALWAFFAISPSIVKQIHSEIGIGMNNNKKLGAPKKCIIQNKKHPKTSKSGPQLQKLKIQDKAISI